MLYFSSLRQAPGFVPGLPRVTLIELRQALVSYQDYHMFVAHSTSEVGRVLEYLPEH